MYKLEVTSKQAFEMIDITDLINRIIKLNRVNNGQVLVYVPHTTAGITVNENADPDVVTDMLAGFRALSPERKEYQHREGNSSAHLLSTLVGIEKRFIISSGRLALGTWQGIYFCEFDGPRRREVWVQITDQTSL
ncbi:MAG: secondary thiamine-phosphate synthase enzyme YjbQ [Methylocystaceae bacterium]